MGRLISVRLCLFVLEPGALAICCLSMKDNLPRDRKPAEGLQGEDKRQSALRDTRGGAYDVTPASGRHERVEEQRTAGEDAQPGADVRSAHSTDGADDLPEGLKRARKGPLNPSSGRRSSTER
jgi:hypothetical protein